MLVVTVLRTKTPRQSGITAGHCAVDHHLLTLYNTIIWRHSNDNASYKCKAI